MTRVAARRIRDFRQTVFAEMSALSARHGAVNLGQGFPDFPAPGFLKEAACAAITGDANQYAHPAGLPALRAAIADEWSDRFGADIDPDRDVTVTSGATEAIFDSIMALVDPGQAVVTFEPFYDSYPASVAMAGAEFRAVRLQEPDWTFEEADLEAAIDDRTRMILLNTPHNPTGKVFTHHELSVIADLAIRHDLIVVTDEVYDRIVFDDLEHVPIATLPGMWERTLTLNSTGKTFSLTGWKVGYAIGPAWLNDALRAVHQFVTFATSTPFQVAMASSIPHAGRTGYYRELVRDYTERRRLLTDALESAGLPVLDTAGSYFLMASFDHLPFGDDVACSRWMIERAGVTPIPPSAFYVDPASAPRLIRFCFAKSTETLEEAGRRLSHLPELVNDAFTTSIPGGPA